MVLEGGTASCLCAFVTYTPLDQEQTPNPTYFCKWNVETPYRSLRGKRAAKSAYGGAGIGRGKSERRPVMGRIGVEISLCAKACRLPHGLSSQESLTNP